MSLGLALKDILTYCGVLVCLVMSIDGSMLTCCNKVHRNNSVEYLLSEAPDPNCTTRWDLINRVIVDENGDVDTRTVLYHEKDRKIILGNIISGVVYRLECPHSGVSKPVNCTDPCVPENPEADPPFWKILFIVLTIFIFTLFISMICCMCKKMEACCEKAESAHDFELTTGNLHAR
ncbi:hypothetical protein MHYP_G00026640 [Metynnis hypsauchen]